MAALTGTNGMLTIANTTDTFGVAAPGTPSEFLPRNLILTASGAGNAIIVDADGVILMNLYVPSGQSLIIDEHFFMGMRPWKCPIKCSTLTNNGRVRMAM